MPRASKLRRKAFSSSRVRTSTTSPAGSTFDAFTSSSTAAARNSPSASSCEQAADALPRCRRAARRACRTPTSARASSSSSGGSTFSYSSLTVTAAPRVEPSPSSQLTSVVSPDERRMIAALDLVDEPLAAELDDVVAVRAVLGDDVDDGDVALAGRAALDGRQLGDHALQAFELPRDRPPRAPRPRASAPRASSSRPARASPAPANSAVKLQSSASLVGSSYSKSGCSAGRARVRRGGAPEPAADVRLDRLGVDALLADLARRAPASAPCPAGSRGCFTRSARSCVACSTAWWTSSRGDLDRQAARSPSSCSSWVSIGEPLNQSARARRRAGPRRRLACDAVELERGDPGPPHPQGVRARPGPARGRRGAARARALGAEPLRHRAVALPRARPGDVRAPRRRRRAERAREARPRADADRREREADRRRAPEPRGRARDGLSPSTSCCSPPTPAASPRTGARPKLLRDAGGPRRRRPRRRRAVRRADPPRLPGERSRREAAKTVDEYASSWTEPTPSRPTWRARLTSAATPPNLRSSCSRAKPEDRLERKMRARGLEPPRAEAHRDLNPARLPVPPHPR